MSLKQQLEADIKAAMLSGDKTLTTTLRGLKSAILYVEVAEDSREAGLSDDKIIQLLSKEAKKRQESADLYVQGGDQAKADAELVEKKIIEKYLPQQLSEEVIGAAVDEAIAASGASGPQAMGQVIGQVKAKLGAAADGSVIARIAKERLNS